MGGPAEPEEPHHDLVSRKLTWILRHSAKQQGLDISSDGWVSVDALLELECLSDTSMECLTAVMKNCPRQRFELKETCCLCVRATPGHHTRPKVSDNMHDVEDLGREQVQMARNSNLWDPCLLGKGSELAPVATFHLVSSARTLS